MLDVDFNSSVVPSIGTRSGDDGKEGGGCGGCSSGGISCCTCCVNFFCGNKDDDD